MVDPRPASTSSNGITALPLHVEHERRESALMVRFTGEIDMTTAEIMRQALTTALDDATAPRDPVVVDLTGVTFFGSAGLAELTAAHQRAINHHIPMRVVAPHRIVLHPLEITGIATTLDLYPDITIALAPHP